VAKGHGEGEGRNLELAGFDVQQGLDFLYRGGAHSRLTFHGWTSKIPFAESPIIAV
jgi:hypothetical protein